jgi:hypothetical protein
MNMPTGAEIRVLRIDDHPLLRQPVANDEPISARHGTRGEAATGKKALQVFREQQPDVALTAGLR